MKEIHATKSPAKGASALKSSAPRTLWAIAPIYRPDRGSGLLAHMHAVVQVLGLAKKPQPKRVVQAFLGDTAVNYHRKSGAFDVSGGSVSLTKAGEGMLEMRLSEGRTDRASVDAYVNVLTNGPKARVDWVSADQLVRVDF